MDQLLRRARLLRRLPLVVSSLLRPASWTIRAFADAAISPLSTEDAAAALLSVAEARLGGITNISGRDDSTFAQFALTVARHLGADQDLVDEVPADPLLIAVQRHAMLETSRAREQLDFRPPTVDECAAFVTQGS